MSQEIRSPFVLRAKQARDFEITGLTEIEVVAGNEVYATINFNRGAPAVTNAQLQQMRLELFTDAEQTSRLNENDESNYRLRVEPIDDTSARIAFQLYDVVITQDTNFYANFVTRQGEG